MHADMSAGQLPVLQWQPLEAIWSALLLQLMEEAPL